jgi:hypothetical protein
MHCERVVPRNALVRGAIAGALGTFALNVATYADVALRNRPPSDVPEKVVEHYVELPKNRASGVGALAGYATGVAGGVVYALAHRLFGVVPAPLRGLGLGFGVMAATDTSSTLAGATDPRNWGASGWLADIVPHAVYGVVTASAFDSWASNQRL